MFWVYQLMTDDESDNYSRKAISCLQNMDESHLCTIPRVCSPRCWGIFLHRTSEGWPFHKYDLASNDKKQRSDRKKTFELHILCPSIGAHIIWFLKDQYLRLANGSCNTETRDLAQDQSTSLPPSCITRGRGGVGTFYGGSTSVGVTHFMGWHISEEWHIPRGLTLVLTWLMAGKGAASMGGGKTMALLLVKPLELQKGTVLLERGNALLKNSTKLRLQNNT